MDYSGEIEEIEKSQSDFYCVFGDFETLLTEEWQR